MAVTDQAQTFGGDDNISTVLADKLNKTTVLEAAADAVGVAPGQFFEVAGDLRYLSLDGSTILDITTA